MYMYHRSYTILYHTSALIGCGIPVSSPPHEHCVMPHTSVELPFLQKKRSIVSRAQINTKIYDQPILAKIKSLKN